MLSFKKVIVMLYFPFPLPLSLLYFPLLSFPLLCALLAALMGVNADLIPYKRDSIRFNQG